MSDVTVEFDQSLHPDVNFDELDDQSKFAFAALDTAYNLLRDYAVRVTLQTIRDAAVEQGQPPLPSDEELFRLAKETGMPEAPASYRDLAPDSQVASMGLLGVFEVLVDQAMVDAVEGLGLEAGE